MPPHPFSNIVLCWVFLGRAQWAVGAFPEQATLPYISATQGFPTSPLAWSILEPALVFSSFLQKLSPYTTTKQKSKQLSAGLAPWAESDKLQSKSEGQDGIKAVLIYVFSDGCGNNFWEFRASSYCIAGSLRLLLQCCASGNLRVDVSDATVPLQHLHSDFSRKKCDFFLRCVNELSVVSLNKADLI